MTPSRKKAGEEIRTPDVQLGNPKCIGSKAIADQELTTSDHFRCTPCCTENEKEHHADPLAGFVASLTPEQRERLAKLLTGSREGDAS